MTAQPVITRLVDLYDVPALLDGQTIVKQGGVLVAADIGTQVELDAESAARAAADSTLSASVTAEATARAAADLHQKLTVASKSAAYAVTPSDAQLLVDPSGAAVALTLEDAVANKGAVHRIGIAPGASILDTPNLVSLLTQSGQSIGDFNLPAPVQAALASAAGAGQLGAATYYYKVTAINDVGETLASNEQSITIATALLASPVANTPTTSTSGGHLSDSATYFYVITALNAAGESTASNVVSVTTGASGSNVNTNTVTWAPVSGATSYTVYRMQNNGLQCQKFALGNVTTFSDTTAWASGSIGTPPDLNLTGASITVTWAAIAGARYYHVYRGTSAGGENVMYRAFATSFVDQGVAGDTVTPPTADTTLLTIGTPRSGAPFSDITVIADGANWRLI